MEHLRHSPRSSFCEWKGQATYYDIVVGDKVAPAAAWSYPQPTPTFASIKDHIAFYPQYMDACWVDGERVTPQPGERPSDNTAMLCRGLSFLSSTYDARMTGATTRAGKFYGGWVTSAVVGPFKGEPGTSFW